MADLRITTQDDLPGPDGDEPYTLFVNQTEYGNARFLRTNVLSARPDLKKYTALRFRQDVKRHADLLDVEAASLTAVIKQLKEGGQIEQLGAARGAKYRLTEQGRAAVESQAGEED